MLYRSVENKIIGGVCGGIAESFDLNVTAIRWIVSLVTIFMSGVPIIVYFVMWAILKKHQ